MKEFGKWLSENAPWLVAMGILGAIVFGYGGLLVWSSRLDDRQRSECWQHHCRDGRMPEWFHDRFMCAETPLQ